MDKTDINMFLMSVEQWIDRIKAAGILVIAGRYGAAYTHKDFAFYFAMWLSHGF